MKTLEILLTLALAVTFNVSPAAAQRNDTRKETAREIKASNKDLYRKTDRSVRKEAKKLTKEGWKSMDLPIEKQLERTWERVADG